MTILSTIAFADLARERLRFQIGSYNADDLALKHKVIAADADSKINILNRELDRWDHIREGLEDVIDNLGNTVTRAQTIRSKLEELISKTFLAQYGDAISEDSHAAVFDSLIKGINGAAEDAGRRTNLIGKADESGLKYITDIYQATETVDDTFLGTDYVIEQDGGVYEWRRDTEYGYFLRQHEVDTGATTGVFTAINGGVRLDSISGSDVTFTIDFETDDAQQFSGTIVTDGLGILDAWAYENMQTSDGRTRALEDINLAKVTVDMHIARLKGELASAQYYDNKADVRSQAINDTVDNKTRSALLDLQEAQTEAERRQFIADAQIEAAKNVRFRYKQLLQYAPENEGISKALVDVLA